MGHQSINYRPILFTRFVHELPHLNLTFQAVNSTFDPYSHIYVESLLLFASLPILWLILTFFLLLLYLLTRCCDRKSRTKRTIDAFKVLLAVLAILCCAIVGCGLYGNDILDRGIKKTITQSYQIDGLVSDARNQTVNIEQTVSEQILPQLSELKEIYERAIVDNQSALIQLKYRRNLIENNATITARAASDIRRPLQAIHLQNILFYANKIETIRWPVTYGALGALLFLFILLLIGLCRHSRCTLIFFSVCGLIAIIGICLTASIYLPLTIGLADLCMMPDRFLASEISSKLHPEVLNYYTQCESVRANPFTQRLREARIAVTEMRSNLNTLTKQSIEIFHDNGLEPKFSLLLRETNEIDKILSSLTALLDCRALHENYVRGLEGVCNTGLVGLFLLLASSVLSGIFLTLLVCLDSHTWIYFSKRPKKLSTEERHALITTPSAPTTHTLPIRTQRSQGYTPQTPPPSYTSVVLHSQHVSNSSHETFEMTPLIDGCDGRQQMDRRIYDNTRYNLYSRGQTLGRLPSHSSTHDYQPQHHHNTLSSTNSSHNKYATLSKQCKTLQSSDFY